MQLVERLAKLGCRLFIKGDAIAFQYQARSIQEDKEIKLLLEQVKLNKAEVMALLRGKVQPVEVVSVDIETTGLNPRTGDIRLIAYANTTGSEVFESPLAVKETLSNPNILKVFHNAPFDVTWLEMKGYPVRNYIDTMVMAQVLSNNKGEHSLAQLAYKELGIELDKTLQKGSNWQGNITEEHQEYCRKDAEVTLKLYHKLLGKIQGLNLSNTLNREIAALPLIVRLQKDGIPFDSASWQLDLKKLANDMQVLEQEILTELNSSIKLSSPKQLLDCLRNRGVRIDNTSDEELARCEASLPVIAKIRRWRGLQKLVSSTGNKWLEKVHNDGRIYANWRLIGTTTGRMTCSGPNLQQIPHVLRPYFKAPNGKVFVICDYSQIELRVVAHLSKDTVMLDAFARDIDLHKKTAQMILNKEAISKGERQVAKTANFGLIYGMSPRGLQARVKTQYGMDISEVEAEKFRNGFFRLYKGIVRWHNRQLLAKHIHTLGGRTYSDLGKPGEDGWRNRYNYPVQGSAAEGLKETMALLATNLPDHWKLCALVHDEVVLEVSESEAEQAAKVLVDCMEKGMAKIIGSVPIKVDPSIKNTWVKD